MVRRIFLDTEWTAPPWQAKSQLMWIGLADEQGRSWYGISSEVDIDPATNGFVSGALRLIDANEPRLTRTQLQAAVLEFCGEVTEFWAWIPTLKSFADGFGLGEEAPEIFRQCRDIDLQMLRGLVDPWPPGWPSDLHDLNAAAMAAGVDVPPRAPNHLHPRVHAEWNQELFDRIRGAAGASAPPNLNAPAGADDGPRGPAPGPGWKNPTGRTLHGTRAPGGHPPAEHPGSSDTIALQDAPMDPMLTADAVIRFLHGFEELANQEDFRLIHDLISERAHFRFNDGDFIGRAAVQSAYEKSWRGHPGVKKARFYLSDIVVLTVDHASATATYTYHWEGHQAEVPFQIQGRGTRVLALEGGVLRIVHEHLSRFPASHAG